MRLFLKKHINSFRVCDLALASFLLLSLPTACKTNDNNTQDCKSSEKCQPDTATDDSDATKNLRFLEGSNDKSINYNQGVLSFSHNADSQINLTNTKSFKIDIIIGTIPGGIYDITKESGVIKIENFIKNDFETKMRHANQALQQAFTPISPKRVLIRIKLRYAHVKTGTNYLAQVNLKGADLQTFMDIVASGKFSGVYSDTKVTMDQLNKKLAVIFNFF